MAGVEACKDLNQGGRGLLHDQLFTSPHQQAPSGRNQFGKRKGENVKHEKIIWFYWYRVYVQEFPKFNAVRPIHFPT